MKKILTIAILLMAVCVSAKYKRYFDANRKGLDRRIQKGKYCLVCQTKEEFNMSGNSANIVWESTSEMKEVTFTNMDGEEVTEMQEVITWTPRLKTTQELANEYRTTYERKLAQALIQYLATQYNTDEKIGLMDLDKYGNNAQKTAAKAIRDWIKIVQDDFLARLNLVKNATTMELLKDVDMDFSNNDATKPPFTYIDVLIME